MEKRLGQDGLALSGGEKRRLEIARALLRKRQILLVDEALSGLDHSSVNAIQHLLITYPGTVIDIEHNCPDELISSYDQVIDLDRF